MLGDSAAAAAGLSPLRPSIAFAEPGRQYSYSRCVATPPRGASSETTILRSRATRPDTRPDARVSRVFSFSRRRAPTPRPRSPSPSLPTPSPSRSPNGGARNLFRFKSDAASRLAFAPVGSPYSLSPVGGDASFESASTADALSTPRKSPRKVARSPFKVLDAPALQDDFYLNLVDWSSHNILAVGLGTCVYLWSACTSRVTKLCDLGPNDSVCSVGWTPRGTYLAVGTDKGEVQIWDAAKCKKVRTMGGHRTRVGCLAWSSALLSSGSRDRNVLQRDVRASEHHVGKLVGHKSEVCGLKWSYDDRELASGGNDNQLFIWSANSAHPVLRYGDHAAAVKAIAWSPHQARSSITLVPIRPRSRGERRSLRTFPGVSVRPGSLAFNPRPRRLSTPLLTPFNSTPTFALYGTTLSTACSRRGGGPRIDAFGFGTRPRTRRCRAWTPGRRCVTSCGVRTSTSSCPRTGTRRIRSSCGGIRRCRNSRRSRGTRFGCCTWRYRPTGRRSSRARGTRRCGFGTCSPGRRAKGAGTITRCGRAGGRTFDDDGGRRRRDGDGDDFFVRRERERERPRGKGTRRGATRRDAPPLRRRL